MGMIIITMLNIPISICFQHISVRPQRLNQLFKTLDRRIISNDIIRNNYNGRFTSATKRVGKETTSPHLILFGSFSEQEVSYSAATEIKTETPIATKVQLYLQKQGFNSSINNCTILCEDPLVYTVSNILSQSECIEYQNYAKENKTMTLSNPPDVSLDVTKLWPLPLLSIGVGIPPYMRLVETTTTLTMKDSSNNNLFDSIPVHDLMVSVLQPILLTFISMIALAWVVVLPIIKLLSSKQSRTSTAASFNLDDDIEFIRPLVERVSNAIYPQNGQKKIVTKNWEAPVVTKYNVGALFARHNDASPTRGSEWSDIGGQRIVTCICYLNTLHDFNDNDNKDNTGGETYFDSLDITVQPKAGTALIFYPANMLTYDADDRTTHESKPVRTGVKWIVQMFGRVHTVPYPLGLPDSF